jgi:hypothetical protein
VKLPKDEKNVLVCLKDSYVEQYGTKESHLDDYTISVIDERLRSVVPHLYENDSNLTELKSVFKELARRGLVRIHGADGNYSLTKEGYVEATKGWGQRFIDYLNANPGVAIIISVFAL